MSDTFTIQEMHDFKGDYEREIPTYPHVNTEMLYENDPKPFHINLAIAELGRVSANGLLYDEYLMAEIEKQLPDAKDGIAGHISEEKVSTDYPMPVVYWVGSKRVGDVLWAKGYIPNSQVREHVKAKIAMGGKIGTSIYGVGVKELTGNKAKKGSWKLREFALQQLDLAPHDRAALRMSQHPQVITSEMSQEEGKDMADETLTVQDVPQAIREQIIAEATLQANAGRVSELETRVSEQETRIAELMAYGEVVANIRATLGETDDVSAKVAEMYKTFTTLREMLGSDVSIEVAVRELHSQINEMQAQAVDQAIQSTVEELTDWKVSSDAGKAKLASLRSMFKKSVVAQMGDKKDKESIAEIAKSVLAGDDFKAIAETVRDSLSGGVAYVGGTSSTQPNWRDLAVTPEGRQALSKKFGGFNS